MPGSTGDGINLSEIRELEERLSKFRIDISPDMTIRGNAWQGFALNTYTCEELGFSGPTPPSTTGACCNDGECSILSESDCTDGGGTYQGDDTICDGGGTCGSCCYGASCFDSIEANCPIDCCVDVGGGTFHCYAFTPESSCAAANPCCDPSGVNCFAFGICIDCVSTVVCEGIGGTPGCIPPCGPGGSPDGSMFTDPFFQRN